MKKLDRLILKELVGPWFFGVAIFSMLILAGAYLFRITDYIMKGVPYPIVMKFSVLVMPSIIIKTFTMASLLATLLGFGRLSGDSEITALKAAGISIWRMLAPTAVFGLLISVFGFTLNELIVPPASLKAEEMKIDIAISLSEKISQPQTYPIYENGKCVAMVSSKNYIYSDRLLLWANIVTFNKQGQPDYILLAKKLTYQNEKEWKLEEGGTLMSADGKTYIHIKQGAWPRAVPKMNFKPADLLIRKMNDSDALSMKQIKDQIIRANRDPYIDEAQINNLQLGYWNKISTPLSALIFCLIGASMGIRPQRTHKGAGFWLSVVISFGYLILTNIIAIYAKGGIIPPVIASFIPVFIGLFATGYIIYKKSL